MTSKTFWQDPYQSRQLSHVVAVAGAQVRLDASIFYAESGGQESDSGSIGGWPVLLAARDGADLVYTLADHHALEVGDAVEVLIDWPRRYRLMRLHFAAELVLEIIGRRFAGIAKTGAHIAEHKARIDFALAAPISSHLPAILAEVEAVIAANLPIISAFSDEAAGRRYWEVAGVARVPCGGTHLKSTGEVGRIALKRKNVGQGRERVEITLA